MSERVDPRTPAVQRRDNARGTVKTHAETLHALLAAKQLALASGIRMSLNIDRAARISASALDHACARLVEADLAVGAERAAAYREEAAPCAP